jgi:hypothetical protein
MSNPSLSPTDQKHIHNAWVWATTIIVVGTLLVASGLFVKGANQDEILPETRFLSP